MIGPLIDVPLVLLDAIGLCALTTLPVVILLLRGKAAAEHAGRVVLVAGGFLALHCLLTVVWLQHLQVVPMLPDPAPFDRLILSTLNLSIPSVLLGVLLAVYMRPRVVRHCSFWTGVALLLTASLGLIWRSHCFFGNWIRDNTWWL